MSMGIYSIRVRCGRSLLVGKCVNALEQRLTIVLIPYHLLSSRRGQFFSSPFKGVGVHLIQRKL